MLLYVTRDITYSHLISRPFRILIHEKLKRNFQNCTKICKETVLKDCKAQERLLVTFLLRFQGGCTRL